MDRNRQNCLHYYFRRGGFLLAPEDSIMEVGCYLAMLNWSLDAGADPTQVDADGLTPARFLKKMTLGFGNDATRGRGLAAISPLHVALMALAAGDKCYDCLPSPCLGIGNALLLVWNNDPKNLYCLFNKLEKSLKIRVQTVLKVLHRRLPQQQEVHMRIPSEVLACL